MYRDRNRRTRAVPLVLASAAAFLFAIIMNFLANYLPINGITTAEVSDKYYHVFTPAGFTFAIWGVIYVALALLVAVLVWGTLKGRERPVRVISEIGPYFIASCVFNGAWIVAWHYETLALSLALIVGLLISLSLAYRRLKRAKLDEGGYLLPFSIYLAWISVATLANAASLAVATGLRGLGLPSGFWLTVLLLVSVGLSAYMIQRRGDYVFGLVILWALSGITVARWNQSGGASYATAVAVLAGISVALMVLGWKYRQLAR